MQILTKTCFTGAEIAKNETKSVYHFFHFRTYGMTSQRCAHAQG